MFQAYGASLRSASLGRQVGACLSTDEGQIIALGTNEVPKAGGGQYWAGDTSDGRDFQLGSESNDLMKKQVFKDILSRLKNAEWLSIDKQRLSLAELCVQADAEALTDGAMFEDLIEFLRCVHAEMGAIIDAARSGIAVKDSVMHVTTFPCHECARHIIGAGIKKVYFIEPYPKSQAVYLHKDAIELEGEDTKKCHFLPFVGVSPRLYTSLFLMGSKRKTGSQVVKWTLRGKIPRMHALADQYLKVEATYVEDFYGIWENSELVNEK